ncbi:MAG: 1-acyl-sn-glycerol-3-phosphate acyltransferase [Calditrichaeota bacterium]|nr:1-acyl-sn-glycerol-3-phosphate acyltransferase [Calditrichota bacterium]
MIVLRFIHTLIVYIVAFLSTGLFSSLAIISGSFNPYSKMSDWVIKTWARSILWVSGVKLIVEGLENVDQQKPYIFAANHIGAYDILATVIAIPQTSRFIAKTELFKIPLLAQGMRMTGMLEIDRKNSEKAKRTLDKAVSTIKDGCSVIIFPEGTRSKTNAIQPFKKGGFILAINGRISIIPTVISGTQYVFPKGSKIVRTGKAKVKFLKELNADTFDYEKRNELVIHTRQQIVDAFEPEFNRS